MKEPPADSYPFICSAYRGYSFIRSLNGTIIAIISEFMDKVMTRVPLLNTKEKLATPSSGTTIYVDYSKKKKTLEVAFYPQKVYHYYPVEEEVWENYKKAIAAGESSGQFVNFKVKPIYNYTRVR